MASVGASISYPFVFVLPDGKLLVHGGTQTMLYNLPGLTFDGTAIEAAARPDRDSRTYGLEGTSVLLPLLPDSNPPYRGRVMAIGGGRSVDKLDVFVVGLDGRVWTAAWEPRFTDGWHGWWPIRD